MIKNSNPYYPLANTYFNNLNGDNTFCDPIEPITEKELSPIELYLLYFGEKKEEPSNK